MKKLFVCVTLCMILLLSAVAEKAWYLTLVNASHPIPEDYVVGELVSLQGGQKVARRILPELQAMFDAARADGLAPVVLSGYRSHEKQVTTLENRIQRYINQGYSREKARTLALEWVAEPGTSEHELGICVDVNVTSGSAQKIYDWLASNAWKYGFILRYPKGKTKLTGIDYEPWHYRYVGREAAFVMYREKLCLEEYLRHYSNN